MWNATDGLGTEMFLDRLPKVSIWNPSLELDRALLPLDSSIRDFQKGKVGYVANALEQPLLLPQDMANLRSLKKHKVFLTLKRDLPWYTFQSIPCTAYTYTFFIVVVVSYYYYYYYYYY